MTRPDHRLQLQLMVVLNQWMLLPLRRHLVHLLTRQRLTRLLLLMLRKVVTRPTLAARQRQKNSRC